MLKYAVILAILLIGGSTYVLQEAEAIEKIIGYVSEAKKRALAEAEAKANATAIENYVETIEAEKEDTTNRSDDEVDVVKIIRGALGLDEEEEVKKKYTKIVGIQLSRTCLQMERNNVTSNCQTYKDLMQFDNMLPEISGNVTYSDGYWHREKPDYKKHCNWYLDKYPVLIIVDPDGCWQRETGIRMITIQAISPEKMIFKLKADRGIANDLRELQRDEKEFREDKDDAENKIDSLEDQIDDLESRVRSLKDDIKDNEADKDKSSLSTRNLQFQLRFAEDKLADREIDLVAEEIKLEKYIRDLNSTKVDRQIIQTTFSSTLMVAGQTSMGIGRYVEECRNATIGSDQDLLVDTLNFLLFDCTPDSTNFNSVQTTIKEQTPLLISDFTEYKYKKWLAEAKERCKQKC